MSKWDELEKAAIAARDMPKSVCIRVEDVEFREIATPEAILSLIEQNRGLLEALKMARAYVYMESRKAALAGLPLNQSPEEQNLAQVDAAIRKATGEEE